MAGNPVSYFSFIDPATGDALSFATAQSIGPRTIAYANLPILVQQDANASLTVTRNADLVPDRVTNSPFVYTTPSVEFSSPFRPAIVNPSTIDVSSIGSPPTRTLEQALTALFAALVAGAAADSHAPADGGISLHAQPGRRIRNTGDGADSHAAAA
jgi:hypothetical protein